MDFNFEKIIQETIGEYVDVEFNEKGELQNDLPILYQCAFEDRLPSIFKNGFSREYAASAGGNYYCTALYTTFNLRSTIENSLTKSDLYGGAILKIGLKSYDRFLIFNKQIAKNVYGDKYMPEDQLKILFVNHPKELERIQKSRYYYDIITLRRERTGPNVAAFCEVMGGMRCGCDDKLNKYDIRGFVFNGANDGDVAIVRDFKAMIPLAFSLDGAKTWNKKYFSQKTIQNTAKDYDPLIFLGGDTNLYVNPQNYRFINGFWVVQRKVDGKYNFMDNKKNILFPEYWFDNASKFDRQGKAMVKIDDIVFYVDKFKHVYEKQNDKYPVMTFEEFLEELKNM